MTQENDPPDEIELKRLIGEAQSFAERTMLELALSDRQADRRSLRAQRQRVGIARRART